MLGLDPAGRARSTGGKRDPAGNGYRRLVAVFGGWYAGVARGGVVIGVKGSQLQFGMSGSFRYFQFEL